MMSSRFPSKLCAFPLGSPSRGFKPQVFEFETSLSSANTSAVKDFWLVSSNTNHILSFPFSSLPWEQLLPFLQLLPRRHWGSPKPRMFPWVLAEGIVPPGPAQTGTSIPLCPPGKLSRPNKGTLAGLSYSWSFTRHLICSSHTPRLQKIN